MRIVIPWMGIFVLNKGSSIKYIRKIFRKTNTSNLQIRTRTRAHQGVRNVNFSENFVFVLNGWSLSKQPLIKC